MKYLYLTLLLIFSWLTALPQISTIPAFGTDSTLEVATWNVENFPKKGQTTISYLWQIIDRLDIDIIAFQEIEDTVDFKQAIKQLPEYNYYCKANYYGGLACIYKKDLIHINDIYEIYTTSPYWSPFPRAPQVIDFTCEGERVIIINNHFKCCGDGILQFNDQDDEETRRYRASNYIKDYIDTFFNNQKVLVVGDLNDEITDASPNNVFINLINAYQDYAFADMAIAQGSSNNWSYPSWPSHLDHILMTNELYEIFEQESSEIQVLKIDEYLSNGWYEYDNNVTDHRPVAVKLRISDAMGFEDIAADDEFTCFPNPASERINFLIKTAEDNSHIQITDINGKTHALVPVSKGQNEAILNLNGFVPGIYIAKFISDNRFTMTRKIIVY